MTRPHQKTRMLTVGKILVSEHLHRFDNTTLAAGAFSLVFNPLVFLHISKFFFSLTLLLSDPFQPCTNTKTPGLRLSKGDKCCLQPRNRFVMVHGIFFHRITLHLVMQERSHSVPKRCFPADELAHSLRHHKSTSTTWYSSFYRLLW